MFVGGLEDIVAFVLVFKHLIDADSVFGIEMEDGEVEGFAEMFEGYWGAAEEFEADVGGFPAGDGVGEEGTVPIEDY